MARAFRHAALASRSLTGSEVARMLGITRQAVNQRAGRGSLLAVADADGVRYPTWQFRNGSPTPGLLPLVRAARAAGVDDAALAEWIEVDYNRINAIGAGRARALIGLVGQARRPRTPVRRHRGTGPAPRLADNAVVD